MVGNNWNRLVLKVHNLVSEDLHVTHAPISKEAQKNGPELHKLKGGLVELVVIHWGTLVEVG
jgi:hypothetical protein